MRAIERLLDKARETCSLASDNALAQRMGVSRQLVSNWRKATAPVSDDRIAQLARLAHEDAGSWLVQIHAEQADGEAGKAWAALAKRLAAAAACVMVAAGFQLAPAPAQAFDSAAVSPQMYIMSTRRRLAAWIRAVFTPAGLTRFVPA